MEGRSEKLPILGASTIRRISVVHFANASVPHRVRSVHLRRQRSVKSPCCCRRILLGDKSAESCCGAVSFGSTLLLTFRGIHRGIMDFFFEFWRFKSKIRRCKASSTPASQVTFVSIYDRTPAVTRTRFEHHNYTGDIPTIPADGLHR